MKFNNILKNIGSVIFKPITDRNQKLSKLLFTKEQKRIFKFVESETGHGIIDAVAGSGKTTTIIECAKFAKDKNSILFCAFNNSIASEIKNKFQKKGMNEVTVKTIHALGRQILQDNNFSGLSISLNENKYSDILKSIVIKEQLKPFYNKLIIINGLDPHRTDENNKFAINKLIKKINLKLIDIIHKFRSTLTKEDIYEFEKLVIHFNIFNEIEIEKKQFREEIEVYFQCTKILLKEGNDFSLRTMKIDFTDMIYLPYKWNQLPIKKYDFIFIDECQDLSKSQFAVTTKYGNKNARILAVGDPHQSIYGFTGADINSFNRVKEYTNAVQLPLNTCFRCPRKVIDLAKQIRADIKGSKKEDGLVEYIKFDDIIKLTIPGDLIISRLKAPLVLLLFIYIDKEIQIQINSDEVSEIIIEIKNMFTKNELYIDLSALKGGFDELKVEILKRLKWIVLKNSERISNEIDRENYIKTETQYFQKKLEFIHKKCEQWKNECVNLNEIIKKIKLLISTSDEKSIKLSTIHRAKGLENNRVFILNYNDLPLKRPNQKEWEKTQEINLKYVAITRSLNELYLIDNINIGKINKDESLFDNLPFD